MIRTHVPIAAALLAIAASLAHAQPTSATAPRLTTGEQRRMGVDPRWSPWLGCWTPAARSGASPGTQLCIVPSDDGTGVRMITFDNDREILGEVVIADGTPQPMADKGCSGQRTTRWSTSGLRLFSASSQKCADEPEIKTTGLSALVTADQWIDVQVADAHEREQVRVRRFWRSSAPAPAPVSETVRQLQVAHAALTPIGAADVIEASAAMPTSGVEAWLADSGARVVVDRRALLRLSEARISVRVIDLMVALAYPTRFEVHRATMAGSSGVWSGVMLQPLHGGDDLADLYGFGFGALGMPFFFDTTWYNDPGWIYDVPGSGGGEAVEAQPHGRVVNGQGYTQVEPREPYRAGGARPGSSQAATSGGDGAGGSSSSGDSGSSSASPAGYSGGGGTSTGLTAVPR